MLRAKLYTSFAPKSGPGRTAHGPRDWPPALPVFGFAANLRRPPGYALRSSLPVAPASLEPRPFSQAIGPWGCPSSPRAPIFACLQALASQLLTPSRAPPGPAASPNSPASIPQLLAARAARPLHAHQYPPSSEMVGQQAANRSTAWIPPAARAESARGGAVAVEVAAAAAAATLPSR